MAICWICSRSILFANDSTCVRNESLKFEMFARLYKPEMPFWQLQFLVTRQATKDRYADVFQCGPEHGLMAGAADPVKD